MSFHIALSNRAYDYINPSLESKLVRVFDWHRIGKTGREIGGAWCPNASAGECHPGNRARKAKRHPANHSRDAALYLANVELKQPRRTIN
jgi:hypothetical protein